MMTYKGYHGTVTFDDEAGTFHGEVTDLRGVVTFQGRSVDELKTAFHESIDGYPDFCSERGEEPDCPYSGNFVLRIDPQLHRKLVTRSREVGSSLNRWLETQLKSLTNQRGSPKGSMRAECWRNPVLSVVGRARAGVTRADGSRERGRFLGICGEWNVLAFSGAWSFLVFPGWDVALWRAPLRG